MSHSVIQCSGCEGGYAEISEEILDRDLYRKIRKNNDVSCEKTDGFRHTNHFQISLMVDCNLIQSNLNQLQSFSALYIFNVLGGFVIGVSNQENHLTTRGSMCGYLHCR